jgi:AcrR family transcriptional regulator
MNKTKLKIIRKSISLFNEHGFSNVSLMKIAEELSLSPGNLTYHFNKKDDLMKAVYKYFQEELLKVSPETDTNTSLKNLDQQIISFYNFQKEFKFFYLDLLEIERAFENLAEKHYTHIQNQIDRLYQVLLYNMNQKNLIRYKSDQFYKHLSRQIWMTSVYWMSQSMARGLKDHVDDLRNAIWYQIFPHMTESGKAEFFKFNKSDNFK